MLAGRDDQLERIAALCRDARDGRGGALVVRGEAGIGKTALLTAASAAAGLPVLAVTGVQPEIELGFAGLHALLDPLLDDLPRLPHAQETALRRAFGQRGGVVTDLAVCTAALALLSRRADRGTLFVIVDDAHCLDAASLAVVLFVARRLSRMPVAMLIAVRDPDTRAVRTDGLATMHLTGLTDVDAERLLDTLAGPAGVGQEVAGPAGAGQAVTGPEVAGPDVAGSARGAVLAAAGGNPLALIELAAMPAMRLLEAVAIGGAVPVGDRLRAAFCDRIERLAPDARAALVVAAAEDGSHESTVDISLLADAERHGLVATGGGRVSFRHPLIRAAAYALAPAPRRRAAHAAIAARLDARGDRARALPHLALAAAGSDDALAAEMARSAGEVAGRGGLAAAALVLRRAALLTGEPGARARRFAEAAYAAWKSGQVELARELVAAVGGRADRGTVQLLAKLRGMIELYGGDQRCAFETLSRGAEAANPDEAADILLTAGDAALHVGDTALFTRIGARIAALDCDPGFGQLAAWFPPALDGALTVSPWRLLADAPRRVTQSPAHRWVIPLAIAWMGGDPRETREFAVRAADDIRESGMLAILVVVLPWLAELEFRLGHWEQGEAHARDGLRLAADLGQVARVPDFHALLALFAAVRDDGVACQEHAGSALAGAIPAHNNLAAAWANWALGLHALGAGQPERAAEFLSTVDAEGSPARHWLVARRAAADAVEAQLRSSRRALAEQIAARWPAPRAAALLETEPVEDRYRTALSDSTPPFERARAALSYGQWLRRTRQTTRARTQLRLALDLFGGLGAPRWAALAGTELRAAGGGGATPKTARNSRGALTPQEQAVVRLAAKGMSNREIGERLFLSPRTVGYHLYKVFPKLGVSCRAQLRDIVV